MATALKMEDAPVKLEYVFANWNSLSTEVMHRILLFASVEDKASVLCQMALVCQAWLQPVQAALYSNVSITTLPQLQKFYNVIKNRIYLGKMVKVFCIDITDMKDANTQHMAKVEILEIVKPLLFNHMPNLERLIDLTLHSYTFTVDALLGFKLKRLKLLGLPNSNFKEAEIANYITCCFLMKGRLENMLITDNTYFNQGLEIKELFFDRLFNNIHQFNKLKTLHIHQKTNETIQILEHVVNNCKSLKDILFYFEPLDNTALRSNNNIPIDAISELVPVTNVKSLTTQLRLPYDHKLLLYMIHKFSQLQTLSLNMLNDTAPIYIKHQTLSKLLYHLSNLYKFSVSKINVDKNTITKIIGSSWKSIAEHGSQRVELVYKQNDSEVSQNFLDISKRSNSLFTTTTLTYHDSAFDFSHVNRFTKRNGKYIRELRIACEADVKDCTLPENFMSNLIIFCPNLSHLHIQQCNLELVAPFSHIDLSKRSSLKELYFDNCQVYAGILEHWSLFLPEVKCLRLNEITYHAKDTQPADSLSDDPYLQIAMPCTKIDLIVLEEKYSDEPVCVKVFDFTNGIYHYYQHDPYDDGRISSLSEEDYENATSFKRIFICCQSKPRFLFKD